MHSRKGGFLRRIVWILAAGGFFLFCGFKLEKDPIELTRSELKKAPSPDEEKKIPEVPVSPSFRSVGSLDRFMTKSSITPEKKTVAQNKAVSKVVKTVPKTVSGKPPGVVTGKASEEDFLGDLMLDEAESDAEGGSGRSEKQK
ncbi:MAG TPA: hypothetical protein PKL97_09940 [Candidatus Omnitrophota bacterium]|nr:hypothetical protein [Candidatus Omnitrophota bacterium]